MKMSRRAKRMERHHKRNRPLAGMNLVSLMDIFTILVFFLLVNSSEVQVLPSTRSVKLPESIAEKKPKEAVVVLVNDRHILVQGRKVATVEQVNRSAGLVIGPLKDELKLHARRARVNRAPGRPFNGEVTILGDKNIPFDLLKKIMVTCSQADYGRISLAVVQKVKDKG